LVSASLGLGRFRERSFQAGGTRFRLAFESAIAANEEQDASERLERAAKFVHARFGRDLGPSYTTIIAPDTPEGDEIAGEAWGTGQGRSLAPLTSVRIHDFAADLIGAYTRYAPYRTEIRRPDEYWLVDGIAGWYSWRAVAAAGGLTEDDVSRSFAQGYLTGFYANGIEQNLEAVYSSTKSTPLAREVLAPFVLIHLDHELRAARGGEGGFDRILPAMYRGSAAPSMWTSLPGGPQTWRFFRSNFARGAALAPVESYFALAPTQPSPTPAGGPAVRRLTLVYTGNSAGFLETCGCKVNQSGGMARRATVVNQLRRQHPNVLLLDAGSSFSRPEDERRPDFFAEQEQRFYLRLMDSMGYGAATIGMNELGYGLPYFRSMTQGMKTPFLVANVRDGRAIAAGDTVLRSGGLRVDVVGVFEPPRVSASDALFEEQASRWTIEDPIETVRRGLPEWRRRADLVVIMGRLTPTTIRRMVAECPGIDVILSTDEDAPTHRQVGQRVELHNQDPSGFVGRTLVLYTPIHNYGLSSADLGLDASGRIVSAAIEDHWLRKDVPDDPVVRRRMNQFYDEVGRLDAAQASVTPPFANDPERLHGAYVGAAKCEECHTSEYAQWKTTKHASAYKTLLDVHRHYQPRCVSCHVVGYGSPTGYRVGATEEPLGNVQCEVCHGPGAAHVADPARTNIHRLVPASVCEQCHTPDHSDHFVYAAQVSKVRHDFLPKEGGSAALAAGSPRP